MRSSSPVAPLAYVPLLLVVSTALGCSGDALGPDRPDPDPGTAAAFTLVSTSPRSLHAQVATSVTVSVRAQDSTGLGVEGVMVSFEVTAGGGSVTSSPVLATGPGGGAAGSWVLGTAAGTNQLTVSASGLPPVVFTATGEAGPAATVEAVAGDHQAGEAGEPLPNLLRVRVRDVYGNEAPFAQVVFSVQDGGGRIDNAPVSTNEEGVATAGPWTLGFAADMQRVRARAGSASTTLSATLATCPAAVLVPGTPMEGTLATGDCLLSGSLADRYEYTTPPSQALSVTLVSSDFPSRLTVATSAGMPVASGTLLPAGSPIVILTASTTQLVTARSTDPSQGGSYSLAVDTTSSAITNCQTVFIERGVTTEQQLDGFDCVMFSYDYEQTFYDDVRIHLVPGSVLQIDMTAAGFTPHVDVITQAGQYFGGCTAPTAQTCRMSISVAGYYRLLVRSAEYDVVGPYTLTIH